VVILLKIGSEIPEIVFSRNTRRDKVVGTNIEGGSSDVAGVQLAQILSPKRPQI